MCLSINTPNRNNISLLARVWFEDVCIFVVQIMKQPPYELRRRLYIMYKGEDGLDYGGVARYATWLLVSFGSANPL
jgi:atrophin-1 interacting protein 5 (WW domain-containing E3 ubiquitin protein ligase 1)